MATFHFERLRLRGVVCACLAGLFLRIVPPLAGQEQSYFSPENILRFANSLYQDKDYMRAAAEYLRYLSYGNAPPSVAASLYFKIGSCYRYARDYAKSISAFQLILADYPKSEQAEDSSFQIAFCHFLGGRYAESLAASEAFSLRAGSEAMKRKLAQLKCLNYLYQKDWEHADRCLRITDGQAVQDPLTDALKGFISQGKTIPRKSPFLGGVLSALIPGAGKIYAGRTSDGLLSFLTIAATGWQAYEGFHESGSRSAKGWIYGSLSALFYLGNIYGSVAAVRIFNEQSENRLLDKVGITVNVLFQ